MKKGVDPTPAYWLIQSRNTYFMYSHIPAKPKAETAANVVTFPTIVFNKAVLNAVPLTTESTITRPTTAVTSATTPPIIPTI